MSELARSLREGALLTWRHLAEVVLINVLWLVCSWTLIGCGPATLAAYHWLARRTRDGVELSWRDFFPLLLRYLWPGLVWFVGMLIFVLLAYVNLQFWPRVLPEFLVVVMQLFWLYLLVLLVALQPYLLEGLTIERNRWSLRMILSRVFTEPLTAHLRALVPLLLLGVGLRFHTLIPLVLIGVTLLFFAVSIKPIHLPEPPPEEPLRGELGSPNGGT